MSRRFAEDTKVPISQSIDEIRHTARAMAVSNSSTLRWMTG
jgi:hypothetical protein